ncbi:MAG: TlpA disulfide reductase family protein [Pirellulales bacterium]
MMIVQRWIVSSLLAMALGATAVVSSGCNDSQSGARDGSAGATPKRESGVSKHPAPAADSVVPPHPAVSAKVGPNGDATGSPNGESVLPGDHATNATTGDAGARTAIPTPPPGALPEVALSSAHRATCKLFVGDTLPPLTLADLDGNAAPLDKLLGERLTIVAFWQSDDPDAVDALTDFGPLVLAPYGGRGVRVIAIHVGDATDEVKSLAERNQLAFPVLVDAGGAAFSQISDDPRGLMPRIFLVDATGRVLWFDIEYSRTTRRDLDRALRYLTRE